jgi:5'(3')-deoxyribonucleotidase
MKGLIDVDGVLADFAGALLEEFPLDLPEKPPWDIINLYDPERRKAVYERLADPQWWIDLPVIDGAKEGIQYLESLGHKLFYVTSPWESCEEWKPARRTWLNQHFNVPPENVFPAEDKSWFRGDYLIDDKPKHITDWSSENPDGVAYLYDTPFNQNFRWPRRITWSRIREVM